MPCRTEEQPRQYPCPSVVSQTLIRYLEKEKQEELLTAFQEMREEEKQLLYGKYLMDLSDAELAQMLGCKPSSVRMKLTRARRAFVEKLREGGKNHE